MSDEPVTDFAQDSLGLGDSVLRGVYALGFERPSVVQASALPPLLRGADVIAQARSGTGKTGAFAIAACELVQRKRPTPAAADDPLVLTIQHTRELARQTASVVRDVAQFTATRVALLVGGEPIAETLRAVQSGIDIAVGTPGRVEDLVDRRQQLRLSSIELLVIDEVDEVLRESSSNSFLTVMHGLLKGIRPTAQIALFSATLPAQLLDTTCKFMRDPVRLLLSADKVSLQGIAQQYIRVNEGTKYEGLRQAFARGGDAAQTMIFCSTRDRSDELAARLAADNTETLVLHSAVSAADRLEAMQRFRGGHVRVLVCTELLARGVDVQQVGLVVLYDMCGDADTYMHCIGRCGRFGRRGCAITLANDFDLPMLRSISQVYGCAIEQIDTDGDGGTDPE